MFCPECGTKLDNEALFCPECGTKVTSLQVVETATNNIPCVDNAGTVSDEPDIVARGFILTNIQSLSRRLHVRKENIQDALPSERSRQHPFRRLGDGLDSGQQAARDTDTGGTQHQYAVDATHTDRPKGGIRKSPNRVGRII